LKTNTTVTIKALLGKVEVNFYSKTCAHVLYDSLDDNESESDGRV